MAVTAAMVKDLREATGAGMMDCKKALVEADGDMEKAVAWLREKGLASAAKRSGKVASEGLVLANVKEDNSAAVVIEVNSETDFVAKNDEFRSFVVQCANQAVETNANDAEEFLNDKWGLDDAETVKDALTQKMSVIGENLKIRRFERLKKEGKGAIGSYVHGGGKIAVIVYLNCDKECDELIDAGKNIAMQIAAMNPRFICSKEMSQEFIEKEREILLNQAKQDPQNEEKPLHVVEKIVEGRLRKEFKELCLVDQDYIKGDRESVKEYLKSVSKQLGAEIDIVKFVRFAVGEGIEKQAENFADEVAKVMGS